MQFHNHVDTQPVKRFDGAMRQICDIKFGMLQVRKNEISLRKYSTLEGTPATTVNLNRKLGRRTLSFKDTHCQKHSVRFPMSD